MPKPPVPAVPNASKLASNKFRPPNSSKIIKTIVITVYILYNTLAVDDNFETILPNVGPGTSAFITYTEVGEYFGKIASAKTRTPIPPTK